MFICSDCKERERSWTMVGSSGHCDNKRCENYYPESISVLELISIPVAVVIGVKNYKKLTQPKITKYFKTE